MTVDCEYCNNKNGDLCRCDCGLTIGQDPYNKISAEDMAELKLAQAEADAKGMRPLDEGYPLAVNVGYRFAGMASS